MAKCNVDIGTFQREIGDMEVVEKYELLMQATLSEDSLYVRSKETIFHLFDKLNVTDNQKAEIVAQNIANLSMQLSSSAMQSAVLWAKEERDGPYALALIKTQAELGMANAEKALEEICLVQKQIDKICAEIEVSIAGSIRENGSVTGYDPNDACKPKYLDNAGLKYQQTLQVEADTYRLFADSYRKSGVVDIGVDSTDQVLKGLNGTTHNEMGEMAGYTVQQTANAERQRIAYEDSKRNHAANSSASMIGQLLSAEEPPTAGQYALWTKAVDYLTRDYSSTPTG